jgi:hypothetical protein
MSTLITDDVYEAVLAERVCAERSKDSASTLMGVPKTESGRNASAEASYPRPLCFRTLTHTATRSQCQRGGFVSATRTSTHTATWSQCQRGGFVSATIVFQNLDADSNVVAMPARRLRIRDQNIDAYSNVVAMPARRLRIRDHRLSEP